jgi:hypothetical protein
MVVGMTLPRTVTYDSLHSQTIYLRSPLVKPNVPQPVTVRGHRLQLLAVVVSVSHQRAECRAAAQLG